MNLGDNVEGFRGHKINQRGRKMIIKKGNNGINMFLLNIFFLFSKLCYLVKNWIVLHLKCLKII